MKPPAFPLLSLHDLSVGYPGNVVVKNVNLEIRPHDFIALLGANGSGKSTFLKTLAGLIPPAGGSIRFAETAKTPPTVGYIPQAEKLDPIFPVSVTEVVLMGAAARLKPGRRITAQHRESARNALHQVGLESAAAQRFAHLSGGQKQRALFARALMTDPEILVLDEPTSGVDPEAGRAFLELLSSVNQTGVAVLMASHDLDLVRQFVPKVLFFHDRTVESGPAQQILSRISTAGPGQSFL